MGVVSLRTLSMQNNTAFSVGKGLSGTQSGQNFSAFMQNTNTTSNTKASVNSTKSTQKTDSAVLAKATNNMPGLPENVHSIEEMVASGSIDKNCLSEFVLDTVTEGIKELLMDKLGVSAEELTDLMQQLSLGDEDLLDDDNIKAIVMLAYGMVDSVELTMNQEAYDTLMEITKEVHSVVETVCEENNISVDELKTAIEQNTQTEEIPVEDAMLSELEPVAKEEAVVYEETVETIAQPDKEVSEFTQEETTTVDNTEDTAVVQVDKAPEEESADANEERQPSEEHTDDKLGHQDGVSVKVQTNVETVATENGVQTVYTTVSDAVETVRQIVEQIRVQVTPEHSSMEMQLNPENLGKVTLNVSAKHGIVTAHMTVENEAVKAAVESQLIQLKENLSEQGLKVEAVEVSVETKGFERQEQNQSQGQQKAQEQVEKENASRRRSINLRAALAGMEEGTQELSEQEQLIQHIMKAHGNMVDFTA